MVIGEAGGVKACWDGGVGLMKILVTGSRDWRDKESVRYELKLLADKVCELVVIQGGARGADKLAAEVCEEEGWECREYPANWDEYGKSAGVIRNKQMLDEERPDMILAFHEDLFGKSRGTLHMVKYALENRTPVMIIPSI